MEKERKGRLEVRHRAQGAVRSEMADKTALLLCLPLSFPLFYSSPFLPLSVSLSVSNRQRQGHGKL